MNNMDMDTLRNRINKRCKDLHITHTQLADKSGVSINTINSWFRKDDINEYGNKKSHIPHIDTLYQVAVALDISLDYLTGLNDFTHAGNKDMCEFTGLSDTAIECLRGWYQDQQQGGLLSPHYHNTDTLNTILEYYGKKRTNSDKLVTNIYSVFCYISAFFNAHKFKRVQQDKIRYGNGNNQYFDLEKGDKVIRKETGQTETINTLCVPISSGSFRGEDTTKLDIVNTENEKETSYFPVAGLYREYAKNQIITELKNIGGIE